VVNVALAYANEFGRLTDPSGTPAFNSVQDLAQMNQVTGTDPITFTYVPSFTATVAALELTFNFTHSFGGTNRHGPPRGHLNPVIDATTPLADLNGGNRVQFSTTGGADLSIALSDGTTFTVTFDRTKTNTIGDVLAQINNAPGTTTSSRRRSTLTGTVWS